MKHTITVSNASQGDYPVVVGPGAMEDIPQHIPGDAKKLLIIHAPALSRIAEQMKEDLSGEREVFLAEVPDAEAAKRVEVAAFCWGILGQLDFQRNDAILGLGGGATTDLAGFVAAAWLRGVALIQVPTTVLAMVDAAVGGKTGVNTQEGKNLVGVFYSPRAVIADTDVLAGLGDNEVKAGMAEVVKCGFISDPTILDVIEANPEEAIDTASEVFVDLVRRAVAVKAAVVGDDFRESGLREILNYGHTLGHAIEHAERYQWRHGAAISIGMVFAAELSRIVANLSDEDVERHRRILGSLGLPMDYPQGRWRTLLATMQKDKKARGGVVRFVVLDAPGKPRVLAIPDESVLFAAYQELGTSDS
ncbi:MAG: 3-dehydroquinate synthase [Pontimonas sp.]